LISPTVALTAAHCVDPRRHRLSAVGFGEGAARRTFEVSRCQAHPRFDGVGADFDLALCWLQVPKDDTAPTPLSLGTDMHAEAGESVCVVGFHGPANARSVRSRAARVKQLLTAGTARLALESCAGDSGSVVFVLRDEGLVPFGVLSGGDGSRTGCSSATLVARIGPALPWLARPTQ
jgi:secreted trypsin-like serine protease